MKIKWSLILFVILFALLLSGYSGEESSEDGQESAETEEGAEESTGEEAEEAEDEVVLQEVELMDGAITIMMPEDFTSVEDELVAMDYQAEYIPAEIYMNTEGTVNFALKHDDMPLAPDEVANYIDEMTALLSGSESLILLSSGVNEIDGHDIGYLNIVTEQEGKQVYNSVWVTSLDGTALFGSVNCYDDVAVKVKPIAEDMYRSIKFN